MIAKWYGKALENLFKGLIDLDSHTLKVMLCTSAYTPDQDAHSVKADVTGEVSGDGYTAGGVALSNVSISYDAASNTVKLDANDVEWANSTLTAQYAVIYDATANLVLGYLDFESDISSSNASFKIVWNAAGILTIAAS